MIRSFIFLSTIFTFSCGQNKKEAQSLLNEVDPKQGLNIQMNRFSEIDSSGILMFPLSMSETNADGGSLSYKEIPNSSFWNIIFLNSKTNYYHLLSDKKILIRNYDFKYSENGKADVGQTSRHIFYSVTSEDFNKDKKLTDEDPKYLYVSDKEGNNFRRISPQNYDLQNWKFINSTNKILLTVKIDSDKNYKFDEKDEVMAFEFEIDKGTESTEVFSIQFKDSLKVLFDRDWKRLKK
jgi:hypothetical protein